jgi:hypothetical protein
MSIPYTFGKRTGGAAERRALGVVLVIVGAKLLLTA